jgi:hypothetical protein
MIFLVDDLVLFLEDVPVQFVDVHSQTIPGSH